jgi:ribosomal protein S11
MNILAKNINFVKTNQILEKSLQKKNKDLLLSLKKPKDKNTKVFLQKEKLKLRPKLREYLKIQRNKIEAKDAIYGLVSIKCAKRNIYLTLADNQGRIKATISTGYLKAKGKARKAIYFMKILAKRFTQLILNSKIKKIHLSLCGYIPRKIKRIFLRTFKYEKRKFKIYKFTRRLKSPHNGCRPPKIRRK